MITAFSMFVIPLLLALITLYVTLSNNLETWLDLSDFRLEIKHDIEEHDRWIHPFIIYTVLYQVAIWIGMYL